MWMKGRVGERTEEITGFIYVVRERSRATCNIPKFRVSSYCRAVKGCNCPCKGGRGKGLTRDVMNIFPF